MTPRDFCFWLQGYLAVGLSDGVTSIDESGMKTIKKQVDEVLLQSEHPPLPWTLEEKRPDPPAVTTDSLTYQPTYKFDQSRTAEPLIKKLLENL